MLHLVNLEEARRLMLDELESDLRSGRLYLSPRLSEHGRQRYPDLIREAIEKRDDAWLAERLRAESCFNATETRQTKRGPVQAAVPMTAADTLAEGEFNRFYARGLSRVAVERGLSLVVYRAKDVTSPRAESERMIGSKVDPTALLNDLRTHPGVDTALHLPAGPNSGLSVRL